MSGRVLAAVIGLSAFGTACAEAPPRRASWYEEPPSVLIAVGGSPDVRLDSMRLVLAPPVRFRGFLETDRNHPTGVSAQAPGRLV